MAVDRRPRTTLDIDIMFELASLCPAEPLGFTVAAEPMEFHDGRIQTCRLCKIDSDSVEELMPYLLIVTSDIQMLWGNRLAIEWEGGTPLAVFPERLMALELLRSSVQDRDDVNP